MVDILVDDSCVGAHRLHSEFNYMRNDAGECVLVPGTQPLSDDDSVCRAGDEYWYERTAYRKIPYR